MRDCRVRVPNVTVCVAVTLRHTMMRFQTLLLLFKRLLDELVLKNGAHLALGVY